MGTMTGRGLRLRPMMQSAHTSSGEPALLRPLKLTTAGMNQHHRRHHNDAARQSKLTVIVAGQQTTQGDQG